MNKQAVASFSAVRRPPKVKLRNQLILGMRLMLPFGLLTAYLAFSSADPFLTFACMAVLIIGAKVTWRVGEPPILFAVFFLQWTQVSLLVIQAAIAGVPITYYYFVPGLITATWLSLAGLLVLAAGMRLALGRAVASQPLSQFQAEVWRYSPRRAFAAYLAAQVVLVGIERVIWMYPGLSQAFFALSNFKWAFFFALAVIVIIQRRGYVFLASAFMFEIVMGFMSYFSDFRQVFFVLVIAALTARPKVNLRAVLIALPILGAVLVLLAGWSVVKTEYRGYLNEGSGHQTVLVDPMERLDKIADLMWNVGFQRLGDGFDLMVKRIEYTYYFGRVVDYVPAVVPYTGGVVWGAAVAHVFEPRLLFPDKPSLEPDIANTERYTGMNLTLQGNIADTEIPMGYMAESYVDFGPILMFAPIFLLGLMYGGQYRYLANLRRFRLFAYGAMPVVLEPAGQFGMTAVKILGGSLTVFAVTYLVLRFLAPTIQRQIMAKRNLVQA